MPSIKVGSVVILCFEFDKMYDFWKMALHYEPIQPPAHGWVILRDPDGIGPNISLDKVDHKRTGKRSRLHLDLYVDNQQAEIARLLAIGAKTYPWRYPENSDYVVLEDPDGNLFCVVQND